MESKQQFIAARWFHQAVTWVKEGSPDYIPVANRIWVEERRRRKRMKMSFDAELSVHGRSLAVDGVDLHEYGARVVCHTGIAPGTQVLINLLTKRVVGFAHVRHCTRRGNGTFGIGLQFPAELMPKQPGPWTFTRVES